MGRGFFIEGGSFDKLDKKLSMPIFMLDIGPLEYILALPGVWFGVPLTSLIWMPMVLAWAAEPTMGFPGLPHFAGYSTWLLFVCIPFFLIMLAYYTYLLRQGDHHPFYTTSYLVPLLGVVLGGTYFCSPKLGVAAPVFYLCSYFLTQIFILVGKVRGQRLRPGVSSLKHKLSKVNRAIPTLNYLDALGYTVFESFPSGDAGGAMCFSYSLFLITNNPWSFVFAALSAFGRMYFWAHHLGDVIVAMSISACATSFLFNVVGSASLAVFGWVHAAIAVPSFVILYKKLSDTKPDLPSQYLPKSTLSVANQ